MFEIREVETVDTPVNYFLWLVAKYGYTAALYILAIGACLCIGC